MPSVCRRYLCLQCSAMGTCGAMCALSSKNWISRVWQTQRSAYHELQNFASHLRWGTHACRTNIGPDIGPGLCGLIHQISSRWRAHTGITAEEGLVCFCLPRHGFIDGLCISPKLAIGSDTCFWPGGKGEVGYKQKGAGSCSALE